jgi:hypothetical protein
MDGTGAIHITCWRDAALRAFELVTKQHVAGARPILRLELFRVLAAKADGSNGPTLTKWSQIHTVDGRVAGPAERLCIDSSTRMTLVIESSNPAMKTETLQVPKAPLVITNFQELSGARAPFRVSIAGVIGETVDGPEMTAKGELKREFYVRDEFGNEVRCVAHGVHATSGCIQPHMQVVVFFANGRASMGGAKGALWIFRDGLIILLKQTTEYKEPAREVMIG